jgi:hypothetical protein
MNKPIIPARIGNDVFVRDNEDRTVQYKARVYDIDFAAQEAQVGFYPEREKQFSQVHLPDIYRVTLPLSELSLQSHGGTEQKGYAEALLQAGEPPSAVEYLDAVGIRHYPGTERIPTRHGDPVPERALDKTVPVPQVSTEDEIPQPDFSDKAMIGATSPAALPPKPSVITTAQVMAAAAKVVSEMGKAPPLFTKEDVIAKCKQLREQVDNLIKIAEGL